MLMHLSGVDNCINGNLFIFWNRCEHWGGYAQGSQGDFRWRNQSSD